MINTKYTIQSDFIKKKIKDKSYRNERVRVYIADLVLLERFITTGYEIAGPGMNWTLGLIRRYQKEYLAILKELNPRKYHRYLLELKKEREESVRINKKAVQDVIERQKAEKKWWVNAGGVL